MKVEEFGDGDREVLGTIPMEDEEGGATKKEVVSIDHLRAEELAEGINGNNDYGDRILMGRDAPLEEMISTSEKGGKHETRVYC